jgi:general secretion pathway protein I
MKPARPGRRSAAAMRESTAAPASPGFAKAGGFTLIEVMVALAIIAVALGAGIRAAGALTDNAQRLADVSAAHWCAENHLTTLWLLHDFNALVDGEFPCEQLGRTYAIARKITPLPQGANYRRIDLTVRDDAGAPLLTLITTQGRR